MNMIVNATVAAATSTAIAADNLSSDAELRALGKRLEPLVSDYMNVTLEWASRSRAASNEVPGLPDDWAKRTRAQQDADIEASNEAHKRHGSDAMQDRMSVLYDEIEPIVETIVEMPASSLEGLRAKALASLFEERPSSSFHSGKLKFNEDDDGGAYRSLFDAVAEITGIGPMVRELESRLAADAATFADEDDDDHQGVHTSAPETPDPILAAIEAHRAAFFRYLETGFVQSGLADGTPEHDRATVESADAFEKMRDEGLSLVRTDATTAVGVLTLLQYVDDFATNKIASDKLDPRGWHSQLDFLGSYASHDDQDRFSGEDLDLPFLFWVLRNVSNSIGSMKVAQLTAPLGEAASIDDDESDQSRRLAS